MREIDIIKKKHVYNIFGGWALFGFAINISSLLNFNFVALIFPQVLQLSYTAPESEGAAAEVRLGPSTDSSEPLGTLIPEPLKDGNLFYNRKVLLSLWFASTASNILYFRRHNDWQTYSYQQQLFFCVVSRSELNMLRQVVI